MNGKRIILLNSKTGENCSVFQYFLDERAYWNALIIPRTAEGAESAERNGAWPEPRAAYSPSVESLTGLYRIICYLSTELTAESAEGAERVARIASRKDAKSAKEDEPQMEADERRGGFLTRLTRWTRCEGGGRRGEEGRFSDRINRMVRIERIGCLLLWGQRDWSSARARARLREAILCSWGKAFSVTISKCSDS